MGLRHEDLAAEITELHALAFQRAKQTSFDRAAEILRDDPRHFAAADDPRN